ncbi:DNA/RNA nuclease SfsA [Veillonella tobetsuensis]|uniref:DNA/RNA nuclease SfsA n=1 Tax=Veillonella tobetsuensis TaxID=1110546 RepID=A0A480B8C8_9FIRM|nr:DNA/RNA nuclease SfsA [Veillonella tobetsuensis]GCL68155.1 hypothetical protein PAGU1578_17760 [Veillonella tobetsuensis]
MKVLYDTILKATYTGRPNRFVVTLDLNGESVLAHLPNPGRMWELLFTGVTMYIVPHDKPDAKTKYRVVGIERDGVVIMLDTNYSNDVAEHLIENKLIPGWEEWRVVRREYTVKLHGTSSRFDLLLTNDKGDEFLLEVKSCTLFSKTGAMFPDAITERGRKHLLHLKELQNEGYHTGVLFLVQWDKAQWFLPDYHTDLDFARTFKEVAPSLDWKAVAVAWDETFTMPTVTHECSYPSTILDTEAHDSGVYVMVMHLDHDLDLEIGSKGMMHFKKGYYMYVGSAKANLTKRIERHKRKRKKMHWHLDYFRGHCEMIAAVPIRTSGLPLESWSLTHEPYPSMPSMPDPDIEVSVECALADAVGAIAEWEVPKFGSSDCDCMSHLFGMMENPIHNKKFMDVIEDFRMNQLDVMVE